MKVSLIAAMDKQGVIGYQQKIPWSLPADLKQFREKTIHKPIIMGRRTFLSLGKPLPNRLNIVLSKHAQLAGLSSDCVLVHTKEEALALCQSQNFPEAMIIGGAMIYELFLPCADCLYLTEIDHTFEGDTFFPAWNKQDWQLIHTDFFEKDPSTRNHYDFTVMTFERKNK